MQLSDSQLQGVTHGEKFAAGGVEPGSEVMESRGGRSKRV
jgi:hypothetical protein